LTWELCEEPVGRELTLKPDTISEPTEETDDPFKDIPDLSVDELQEMMRVHGLRFEAIDLIRDQVGYKVRSQHTLDLGAL
jgi:hypothetical protein